MKSNECINCGNQAVEMGFCAGCLKRIMTDGITIHRDKFGGYKFTDKKGKLMKYV
jgi:hypothetical protein